MISPLSPACFISSLFTQLRYTVQMEDAEKQVFAALSDQNFTQYNFLRNKYYSYTHLSSILEIYAFGTIQDYFRTFFARF